MGNQLPSLSLGANVRGIRVGPDTVVANQSLMELSP
jgi:hypothetical protein